MSIITFSLLEHFMEFIDLLINLIAMAIFGSLGFLPIIIFLPLAIISLIFVIKKRKDFKVRTIFLSFLVVSITFLITYSPISIISVLILFTITYSLITTLILKLIQ